jgi:hypothetical protein
MFVITAYIKYNKILTKINKKDAVHYIIILIYLIWLKKLLYFIDYIYY